MTVLTRRKSAPSPRDARTLRLARVQGKFSAVDIYRARGAENPAVLSEQAASCGRAGDLRAPKETLALQSVSARHLYAFHVHDRVG